jgi:trehalose 6-phosphate phosphatase
VHRDPLLERRADQHPGDRGNADERRSAGLHITMQCVGGRAGDRRDKNRRERRGRGATLVEAENEHEQRDDHDPAADAEQRSEEARNQTDTGELRHDLPYSTQVDPLASIAAEPDHAGLFLDIDGVLAPIVSRPEDARVPDETRAELRRLASRYRLVACVTGRPSSVARELVGVPELTYVGEHGLELDPRAQEWAPRIQAFAAEARWPAERKPLTVAFHFRTAADRGEARATLETLEAAALEQGFRTRWGRMVLEVLPPVDASKGTAVLSLLEETGLQRALYAGDDTTDLDGFAALDGLELAVRVAVASAESPSELAQRADLIVPDPAAFLGLLRRL